MRRAPGGGKAFKVVIDDLTRHTSGSMQASAANGFQNTSITSCAGTPFNFQPEFSTAKPANVIPWAALQTNISTEFETGHWESCTSLSDELTPNPLDPADTGGAYNECEGPYENAGPPDSTSPETGDAMCYYAGDTHPGYDGPGTSTPPDLTTGCQDDVLPERRPRLRRQPVLDGVADRQPTDHLPVHIRRTVPDDGWQAVLAVLLPDRYRAERVDVHRDHPQRLHGSTPGTWRLLPVLDRIACVRLLRA